VSAPSPWLAGSATTADPDTNDGPARDQGSGEHQSLWVRLFVAFVVCGAVAWVCYRILPSVGIDVPWWIPLLGFLIITLGAVVPVIAQMPRRRAASPEEQIATPDPGPSPEDLERFGDPWPRLTDRRD
jgi:hypothetical protein